MSSSDASDRVGARPRHAYTETNTTNAAVMASPVVDNSNDDDNNVNGLVGILARRSEDDGPISQARNALLDEDDDDERPLSPHQAILASENNVMGSILRQDEVVTSSPVAIVTTEPSTETDDPSSSLLRKNIVTSLPPRRTISMDENDDNEEHLREGFSNEQSENNNEETKSENDDDDESDGPDRIDLTISPYDYDTNWDMIGHRKEHEEEDEQAETDNTEVEQETDLLNRSGASLLAEAAAATAMLATTAAAATVESPPPSGSSVDVLQGIAPQQPSSKYDYNVSWDMVGRPKESNAATEQFLDDDSTVEETQEEASPLHTVSGCSSLAEAAAVTAMLKSADTSAESPTDKEDHPLHDVVPLSGRTRSTPTPLMFSRTVRPQRRAHDAHYFYNYRHHHHSRSDEEHEHQQHGQTVNQRSTSADNLESLNAISFDEFVNPETRSEMNESITTSTTSSSDSTRRRRPRRFQSNSWSSPLGGSASSVRSRASSVGRAASVNSAPAALPPSASNYNGNSSRRLRASLDSGMASVRRWIRSRGNASNNHNSNPRSSRAARRWQREHSDTLQLGEEDMFALANAGEDPRGILDRHHHDDSSVTFIQQPSSVYFRNSIEYPPMIQEEADESVTAASPRQRSLSEPDGNRLRNFFFERAANGTPTRTARIGFRRRRNSTTTNTTTTSTTDAQEATTPGMSATSAHLQTAALSSSLFHSPQRSSSWSVEMTSSGGGDDPTDAGATPSTASGTAPSNAPPLDGEEVPSAQELSDNESDHGDQERANPDPNREARTRWIRINRRFQLIITMVALVFSLLLFAILVCWVVLTSAYVVSLDKKCDVPLKTYFWLATLQLILDVFRTDIMRVIFRWDTNSGERIPARVIVYNIVYLTYAVLVLRLGIKSVFVEENSTCPETAPELYQTSTVFVVLSISAWSIIVLGYLVPFCFVAMLLTWNGYTPQSDLEMQGGTGNGVAAMGPFGGVFPAAYSNSGAPPGCIDQLRVVMLEEFPENYPHECCICMGDFCPGEVIVATECEHVFHKRCCQEWLRQARTCPVCRTDIPSSIGGGEDASQPDEARPAPQRVNRRIGPPFPGNTGHAFGREDFHQEVVNLFRILRQHEERLRQRNSNAAEDAANNSDEEIMGSTTQDEDQNASVTRASAIESQPSRSEIPVSDPTELEEGRFSR